MSAVPVPEQAITAALPPAERDAILARQAEALADDYRNDPS